MSRHKQYMRFFCFSNIFVWRFQFSVLLRSLLLIAILFVVQFNKVIAQDMFTGESGSPGFNYDELPVTVYLDANLSFDIDVMLIGKDSMYVNVEELFKNLAIPVKVSNNGNKLEGFIQNENSPYSIDFIAMNIKVGNKSIYPHNRILKEMGAVYMEASLLAETFGITMTFNRRLLDIKLKSAFELPVVKQMRLENTRKNISKLRGEQIVADTIIKRNYHLFKFGTLDWAAASYQTWNEKTNNRFGLGLGTELLNGEANISAYYDDKYKFDNRQVNYLWRWIDNDKTIIKQAEAGKISTQSIAFLRSPVVGASIKNTPNTLRKASGFYPVNGVTEPNWIVELYINNILIEYVKADASGLYIFNVPIVYGYTSLKLKFYGPLGEERTEERTINIPYSILPAKEMEYSLSTGVLEDGNSSLFAKGELNYGVNRMLTIGGGLEYLSSISTGAYIPYIKGTIQPFSKLTVNGEYAYGVGTRGLLSYYFGKNTLLELDYAKYVEGQKATLSNAPEERKIRLSVPLKIKKLNGYAKIEYRQFIYPEFTFNYGSIVLSAFYKQFSANSSTLLNWTNNRQPYITSDLALSFRYKKGFVFRPSASYNISEKRLLTCKAEVEKKFRLGYLNIAYEKNIMYNQDYITVGMKYDLPFARTNVTVSKNNDRIMTSESAQGSLAFGGDHYTHVSNNSSLSRGGLLLYPFLDLNQNGIFDRGEPMVSVNSVEISAGNPVFSEKDSIIRIPDLNAFTIYMINFTDSELDNIAWRFKNKIYQVLIDPNQFKRIDVPVISLGEMSGQVNLDKDKSIKGIGRITIKIFDKNSDNVVAQTLSESDGYISYLGLAPGDYYACVDSLQLANLEYSVDAPCKEFSIKVSENGDIVDGIDFVLRPLLNDSPENQSFMPKPETIAPSIEQKDIQFKEDSIVPVSETVIPDNKAKIIQLQADSIILVSEIVIPENKDKIIQLQPDSIIPVSETVIPVVDQKTIKLQLDSIIPISESVAPADKQSNIQFEEDSIIPVSEIVIPDNKDKITQLQADSIIPIPETVIPVVDQKTIKLQLDSIIPISESLAPADKQRNIQFKEDSIVVIPETIAPAIEQKNIPFKEDSIIRMPISKAPVPEEKIMQIQPELHPVVGSKETLTSLKQGNNQPDQGTKIQELVSEERDSIIIISADTLYKVQLLATSKPLMDKSYFTKLISDVPGLKIVEQLGDDGLYHYSTQATAGIEETRQLRRTIMKTGWKDSFVAIYAGKSLLDITYKPKYRRMVIPTKGTIPVKIEPAVDKDNKIPQTGTEVLKTKNDDQTTKKQIIIEPGQSKNFEERVLEVKDTTALIPGDTIFRVQLLALSAPIKIKDYFGLLLSRMPGLKINETQGADGLYHYSAGVFSKVEDARVFNHRIRNSGWVDSFISSYFANQQKE